MKALFENVPTEITVVEVGPRDGLQNISRAIATEDKLRVVNALIAAGLKEIEVTSFVHPKSIPQLADAEALLGLLPRPSGIHYWALAPNEKGAKRAARSQLDGITIVLSASESHNQANVRMSIAESLACMAGMVSIARAAGLQVRAGIATAFGCPYEGNVPPERVIEIAKRFVGLGVEYILLADTTGMADPRQVALVLEQVRAALPTLTLGVHLHNTRGAGMANVLAAWQTGVTIFDSSIGGLGGCPFAPGATGNVCTEDMVHMFQRMKVNTGVDLSELLAAAYLTQDILGFELPGQLMKAGPASRLHPLPTT